METTVILGVDNVIEFDLLHVLKSGSIVQFAFNDKATSKVVFTFGVFHIDSTSVDFQYNNAGNVKIYLRADALAQSGIKEGTYEARLISLDNEMKGGRDLVHPERAKSNLKIKVRK